MCAMRDDGIEEEEFDLDLGLDEAPEEIVDDEPAPRRRPKSRSRRSPTRSPARSSPSRGRRSPVARRVVEEPPEDEYYDDEEGFDEEYYDDAPAGPGGLSPQMIKLIAGGVVILAIVGVISALALKSQKEKRREQEKEATLLNKGVLLTHEAAKMAVEYFASGQKKIPDRFYEYFRSDRQVVDVILQQQPSGSVTFHPVAWALSRKIDRLAERPKRVQAPIPNTEVFDTRGKAVIDMVEYDIRVFRQNIKDVKGRTLGRVAVILFEL